jgi:hypothetical protein
MLKNTKVCEIWGSNSGFVEDSGFMYVCIYMCYVCMYVCVCVCVCVCVKSARVRVCKTVLAGIA